MKVQPTALVKKKTEHFLDLTAMHHLLGDMRNGKIGSLPLPLLYFQLTSFLGKTEQNFAEPVGQVPKLLLEHNRNPRNLIMCEMAQIDIDLVFFYDAATKQTRMEWKQYYLYPELARPLHQQRVILHIAVTEVDGVVRNVNVPLQAIFAGYSDVNEGHQGYSHTVAFLDEEGLVIDELFYIGITSRNWLIRLEEHMAEIRGGSNKRFHVAWRSYAGNSKVMLTSELIVLNQTFKGVMDWEEMMVDSQKEAGKSLNMIPGGFKGLKFLHEHRIINRENISLGERDKAIEAYARTVPNRLGIPNPFLSALWKDDNFYAKVLAGRSDVLSPSQVLKIRELANLGQNANQIFESVQARNPEQVQRVIDGKTYTRIK